MSQLRFGVVWVTAASRDEAAAIAQALVAQKLAACVNIFPIHSIYTWDGAVQQGDEWQLVIKTDLDHWSVLSKTIQSLHSYDVPECIAVPIINGMPEYLS
ncbi:divalent-cation tolerance protein CutA [Okeania sp. SIO2G5]|uniref:divalent-cation tolerance protein CutA n=1 Tax=Okeania sp. SIO2G5 TaxID=2607796 RepID=UPI0013BF4D3F|nr:divalent-cation tolerance protein CutA [Okeania sp. SIO2G5]NEP76471.1 divalent-cation tolerance protein CutA [Okeania sp. SIO2G5]